MKKLYLLLFSLNLLAMDMGPEIEEIPIEEVPGN